MEGGFCVGRELRRVSEDGQATDAQLSAQSRTSTGYDVVGSTLTVVFLCMCVCVCVLVLHVCVYMFVLCLCA